jgi:hypothetical protein
VTTERFPFAFDRRFAPLLALLGVRPATSEVRLDEAGLSVRFGRLRLRTGWDNVRSAEVTRGYRWYRAIGARLSLSDKGVTFGTNAAAGTCVGFHDPVPALLGDRVRHPNLTVTVADPDALADAIQARLAG